MITTITVAQGANNYLQAQSKAIEDVTFFSANEKKAAQAQALKVHTELSSRKTENTVNRLARIEAYQSVSEKAISTVKS